LAGELAATYAIPIIYVPVLMIMRVVAFYLLMRPQPKVAVAGKPRLGRRSSAADASRRYGDLNGTASRGGFVRPK
jgi:hypothetical protein